MVSEAVPLVLAPAKHIERRVPLPDWLPGRPGRSRRDPEGL